ncbi:protein-export chaperone SecB [Helcococcus kunzii]|uniref:Preprotein translocase subunit SecB n=1 Tax=Helcococcus kunzii ATCC 51366 TaxID=883114 RepID=H3NLC9_9FIRM|nr:protein-export chaperone SecB [Helcococcus kunzii]EHR36010.1 hypothetical protein HMPREF9709_00106 [Helcococcus kunzii ATCC 51366]MCT1796594.1 protein-export chaperone SecB [Helcococcus kunzii]MCT1988762.1 protein-export chaperone SecB [Helcococcus kunzii]QUY64038.1 hypothetical protein GUI37_00330 [Helcococcus kunzii]
MMNVDNALADFQLIEYKVVEFDLQNLLINKTETINVNYNINFDHSEVEKNGEFYVSILNFKIKINGYNEEFLSEKFNISFSISGAFSGKVEKLNLDTFEKMLDLNGVALLSQISRSYISTITNLSGMPTINLPMINFNKLSK